MGPLLTGFADELVKLSADAPEVEPVRGMQELSGSIYPTIYNPKSRKGLLGRLLGTPSPPYNRSPTSITTPNPMARFYPSGSQ